jgi:hypothetical protein
MTSKKIIPILLLLSVIISCKKLGNKEMQHHYKLETVAGKDLKFPINNDTKFVFTSLFTYEDKTGNEYLTFSSSENNSILFYNLPTGEYLFDVKLDKEGPNGVGRITGYHIEDLNNIYITSFEKQGLVKVDTGGIVKQFIKYGKTNNGYHVVPSFRSQSYHYTPVVIHNGKIYITQKPYQASKISETPVSVAIDTVTQTTNEFPFRFPHLITDNELMEMLIGVDFGCDFDGKHFVYSFYMDENIYVVPVETGKDKKIPVKSNYINTLKFHKRPDSMEKIYQTLMETSHYRGLLYDKYRKVYYRFTHISAEVADNNEYNPQEIFFSGSVKFSIIIMDENFNLIGETLFPQYTYNPTIAFVHKNGLYISDSHIMNPAFDENILSFKCFILEKKE